MTSIILNSGYSWDRVPSWFLKPGLRDLGVLSCNGPFRSCGYLPQFPGNHTQEKSSIALTMDTQIINIINEAKIHNTNLKRLVPFWCSAGKAETVEQNMGPGQRQADRNTESKRRQKSRQTCWIETRRTTWISFIVPTLNADNLETLVRRVISLPLLSSLYKIYLIFNITCISIVIQPNSTYYFN
jgi:hypothetical protein